MERELQDLRQRMDTLERMLHERPANQAASAPTNQSTSQAAAPAAASSPSRSGEDNLELYGFVQFDGIQDFDRVNPDWEATLRPSRIPTQKGQFGSDGQTIYSVRQSRLGAKATGMLDGKPYEAKFEFDLYGTGADAGQTTIRIRHAYASWGPILAGQTNSLFMDGDLFPNVVDYWGPAGMVFLRTAQFRVTFLDKNGWKLAAALEHATNDIDTGNLRLIDEQLASGIRNDEPYPDFTLMTRFDGDWGHVQLSGILRHLGYETPGQPDNKPKGHQTGWGINLGTAFKISPATLRLGAVYGRGIASYMNDGGMDMAPNVATVQQPGTITLIPGAEAVELFGMTGYVDFDWSKRWTSSIGYSFDKVNNTNYQTASAFKKGEYASVNLLWHPAPNMFTGGELLWGSRTDNNGAKGHDLRFQYTLHWGFSSKNIWSLF